MRRRGTMVVAFGIAAAIPAAALVLSPVFPEAPLNQAFIGGSFLFAGWIATFALRELNAILEREQRTRDLIVAFRAEIFDYSESFDDPQADEVTNDGLDSILTGGDDPETRYHPLLPRISPPVVFSALAADIHLLPQSTIDNVVQFYSVLSDLSTFAEDLMSDAFVAGRAKSRAYAVKDYLAMRTTARRLAIAAIADLDTASLRMSRASALQGLLGTVPYHEAKR